MTLAAIRSRLAHTTASPTAMIASMTSDAMQPMRRPGLGGGGSSISACDAIGRTLAREARQRQCGTRGERTALSDEEPDSPAKPRHAGAGHRARLRQRLL